MLDGAPLYKIPINQSSGQQCAAAASSTAAGTEPADGSIEINIAAGCGDGSIEIERISHNIQRLAEAVAPEYKQASSSRSSSNAEGITSPVCTVKRRCGTYRIRVVAICSMLLFSFCLPQASRGLWV